MLIVGVNFEGKLELIHDLPFDIIFLVKNTFGLTL